MIQRQFTQSEFFVALLFTVFSIAIIIQPVFAVEVSNYRQTGESADAEWTTQSEDGCIYSSVSLSASKVIMPGSADTMPFVYLSANIYNYCTYESIFSWGYSNNVRFSKQGPTKASLTGTIETYGCGYDPNYDEYSCTNHLVDLDVQWIADNATIQRGSYTSRNQDLNGVYLSRYTGTYANASASGSVIQDGTTDLVNGDSDYGTLSNSMSGTISVSHP